MCWVTHCTLTWLLQVGCNDFSGIGIVVVDVMPNVGFVTDDIVSVLLMTIWLIRYIQVYVGAILHRLCNDRLRLFKSSSS